MRTPRRIIGTTLVIAAPLAFIEPATAATHERTFPTVIGGDACGFTMPTTRCATPVARPPAINPIAAPTHAASTQLTACSDPEPSARRVAPSPRRSSMDRGGLARSCRSACTRDLADLLRGQTVLLRSGALSTSRQDRAQTASAADPERFTEPQEGRERFVRGSFLAWCQQVRPDRGGP